jgi:hypothetical protein
MHMSARFQVPKVNLARFKEALHARLSECLAQAAAIWLQTTATGIVPVWSGASRATFSELAGYVGYVLSFPIQSDAPNRIGWGVSEGTGTFMLQTDVAKGLYQFSYSTTLPHLMINEYYNANLFTNPLTGQPYFHLIHPGPYHFQEAGQEAFRRYASSEIVLPGWDSILDTVRLCVG